MVSGRLSSNAEPQAGHRWCVIGSSLVWLILAATLCHAGPESIAVVRSFIAAHNDHDIERMLTFAAEDIRWMSLSGADVQVEASGKSELAAAMTAYFEDVPSTRSVPRKLSSHGDYVSLIEEAQWVSNGTPKSQCAVSVYQLSDGVIANVWYFPAQPCEMTGSGR